jgi:micrococcal nuclease
MRRIAWNVWPAPGGWTAWTMDAARTVGASPIGRTFLSACLVAAVALLILAATGCVGAGGFPSGSVTITAATGSAASTTLSTAASTTSSGAPSTLVGPSSTAGGPARTTTSVGEDARASVLEVIDGDTLRVRILGGSFPGTAPDTTEEVRLIGIDAPETGEDFAQQATDALEKLVGHQEVALDRDAETRDQYGRLLAYVFLEDDTFVNAELLRQGVATLYTVPPNVRLVDTLQQAEDQARAARVGVWAASTSSPLKIADVRYNPPGDDTLDLDEEYVVFQVLATGSLRGYAVEDESGHHFDFSDRTYQKGQTITLHSGRGTDTQSDLYWGATGAAIWNNDGDMVKILDSSGHVVESYAYDAGL